MLSPKEIQYIDQSYGIYDHDWRFYAEFLGEPFLCDDCLVYFDGSILSICAFPLHNCAASVQDIAILAMLEKFPAIQAVRGLAIWGRVGLKIPHIDCSGIRLSLVFHEGESDARDAIVDIDQFNLDHMKSARLARNAARNRGVITKVHKLDRLSASHITLMENFFLTHAISSIHASFYLVLPSLIKNENIFVIEARLGDQLKAFAILSRINPSTACMIIAFSENTEKLHAADAIYAQIIDWAKMQNIKWLHLGYSGTQSLLSFKRKWGALKDGPTFSQARYAVNTEIAQSMQTGTFPWRERLYKVTNGN